MKYFNSILFLIICSQTVFAQHKYGSERKVLSLIEKANTNFIMNNPNFIAADSIKNYALAQLSYQHESGDYRTAQQAQSAQKMAFDAEGYSDIGRFTAVGKFSFSRMWIDSLAHTLKDLSSDLNPYYYFAGKASTYLIQQYQGDAAFSYQVIPEKLSLSMGMEYLNKWTTRPVDPRPDIRLFNTLFKPQIAFQQQQHQWNAGITYGYGVEENQVLYKNSAYNNGFQYPDRILYISRGYGNTPLAGKKAMRTYNTFKGFNFAYSGRLLGWNSQMSLSYLQSKQENTDDIILRKTYEKQYLFTLDSWNAELLFQKNTQQHKHQLQLSAQWKDGADYIYIQRGSSYTVQQAQANLQYLIYTKWNNRWSTEFGSINQYFSLLKNDVSAAHKLDIQRINPGLSATGFLSLPNKNLFKLQLNPSLGIPLSSYIEVPPTQENNFTKQISYPEFYYYASQTFLLQSQFEFLAYNWSKLYNFSIFLNHRFEHLQRNSELNLPSLYRPQGHRSQWTVGLRAYL